MTNRLDAYPQSALRSYCAGFLDIPGYTLAEIRRQLADATARKIPSSTFYQWLAGTRPTPDDIRDYCRLAAISGVLRKYGVFETLSDEELDSLCADLR